MNLALDKLAVQISTSISPAIAAVDGDATTASCTDQLHGQPWWSVDLGQHYTIGTVVITMPTVNDHYRKLAARLGSRVVSVL